MFSQALYKTQSYINVVTLGIARSIVLQWVKKRNKRNIYDKNILEFIIKLREQNKKEKEESERIE